MLVRPATLSVIRKGQPYTGLLTTSGDLINDAFRNLGVEGDGATTPTRRTGLYGGYTNLVTNGGFETDTTGWDKGGTNTIERSTVQSKFGSASLKCTYQDNISMAYFAITLTAAAHSASIWLYIPSDFDGTLISFRFNNFTSATGSISNSADMGVTNQWQEIRVPNVTPDAGDLSGQLQVRVASGQEPSAGKFFYIDGLQVVASPIALPYVETDGGTAAATAGRIQIPSTGMSETAGAVIARVKMGWPNTYTQAESMVFSWGDDSTHRIHGFYQASSDKWGVFRVNGGGTGASSLGAAQTFSEGDDKTVLFRWSPALLGVAASGSVISTSAQANAPALTSATVDFGRQNYTADSYLNSGYHWKALYGEGGQLLSDADSAYVNSLGNDASWEDMPLKEHLVAFWDGVSTYYWSFV